MKSKFCFQKLIQCIKSVVNDILVLMPRERNRLAKNESAKDPGCSKFFNHAISLRFGAIILLILADDITLMGISLQPIVTQHFGM